MKKTPIIITMFLFIVSLFNCSPKMAAPEGPLDLTVSNLCDQAEQIKSFILSGEYPRFYEEVFSPSLKERVSLASFQNRMESFVTRYGRLNTFHSRMESCVQISESEYLLRYVFQYKERTVFSQFVFGEQGQGEDPSVLLVDYEFEDE